MGQPLLNPTSVEGWQGGEEWINTGSVIQRINFCSDVLGNPEKTLVQNIVNKTPDKENILNVCCAELGYIELHSSTKEALNDYIQEDEFKINKEFISILIKLIVSSREYQMV